jgi:hypothetical protein
MLSNATITDYIKLADVSVFLGMDEFQKKRYYKWVDETEKIRILYMVNESMRWGQPYLVGTQGFDLIANYAYTLFGQWILEATQIANTGSGLVVGTPVIPSAVAGAAGMISVTVGAVGSPIPANTNQYTNVVLAARTLIVILDNLVVQPSPAPGLNYAFNNVTGTITFSANLSAGQTLTIIYI